MSDLAASTPGRAIVHQQALDSKLLLFFFLLVSSTTSSRDILSSTQVDALRKSSQKRRRKAPTRPGRRLQHAGKEILPACPKDFYHLELLQNINAVQRWQASPIYLPANLDTLFERLPSGT